MYAEPGQYAIILALISTVMQAIIPTIGVAFLAFLIFTSNPLLQDPGLAFHPPFLYLGYVGLSMAFSFAIAALIEGKVDAAWARWVRPWTLAAWISLTIGISLGSWWAYYELGRGGWWFWDPVENSSFMPWLIATALLHSAIVVEKRNTLKAWTVLLAILAFSFSLIGTFIVRSGVITSVHAFANDPTRGMFILMIVGVTIGGGLTLYALRANKLKSASTFSTISRESGLVLNNLLLSVAAAVVFVGTVWPVVAEAIIGETLSVGPPFFDLAFTPFMVALAMALSIALGALVWSLQTGGRMMAPVGFTLAAWIVLGALADLGSRARFGQIPFASSLRRLRFLPRADWGKMFAHAELGLTIFGISAVTAWEVEDIRTTCFGESHEVAGYSFTLNKVDEIQGPNYTALRGDVTAIKGAETLQLTAEKRHFTVQAMPTTEAAIDMGLTRDVYVVLGDAQDGGGYAMRVYIKPFTSWIWIGTLVMAFGGLMSIFDRRYRMAAPSRKAAPLAATPAE